MNRRGWLAATTCAAWGATYSAARALGVGDDPVVLDSNAPSAPFRYGLNTSTIRGQKLSIVEEVELAARVGYDAIEPWIGELDVYAQSGGSLEDLGKRITDLGLTVESAIGFPAWAVDDDTQRREGLSVARRNMEALRTIGGTRLAAPPVGLTDVANVDLRRVAERYRELLVLGDELGIVPQIEVWGFSKTLKRLGEAAFVVIEADHPAACILADVYHLYKGGNDFAGMRHVDWGNTSHVFHMNDYPDIAVDQIADADRVYPGDGVAPISFVLRTLYDSGYRGTLSLELFNPTYWQQDAELVARRGLESMRVAVETALAPT